MRRLVFVVLLVLCAGAPLTASWSLSVYPGLNLWENAVGYGGLVGIEYAVDAQGNGFFFQGTTGFFSTGKGDFVYRNLLLGAGVGYRLPLGTGSPFSLAGILTLGAGMNHRDDGIDRSDWKASFTMVLAATLEYRIRDGISLGLGLVPLTVANSSYHSFTLGTCLGARFGLGGGSGRGTAGGNALADDIRKTALFRDRVETEGRRIRINLPDVFFASGSFQVTESARLALEEVAQRFREHRITLVQVDGHTDDTGEERDNLLLSQRRAGAVAGILIGGGLPPAGIRATGYGSDSPRYPNTGAGGRQQNRRVEITVEQ